MVDLARMRTLADVAVVRNGPVEATAWADAGHVLAVVGLSDCISTTKTAVVSVDVKTRCLVAKTILHGDVLGVVRARGKLVLLLGPHDRIGTAKLDVVDARGRIRETTLGQIVSDVNESGLAVDSAGAHAFVAPAGDRLAEVDIATLRVGYHELFERTSIGTRLRGWLDPSAQGKGENGPSQQAVWLGDGRLAVTGSDYSIVRSTAAGLRLVDTRDWTYRKLDRGVSSVQLDSGLLLAEGSSYDGATGRQTSPGLIGYSLDGQERYRLFDGEQLSLAVIAGRGYVSIPAAQGTTRTVTFDLESGKVGRTVAPAVWTFLLGDAAPFFP